MSYQLLSHNQSRFVLPALPFWVIGVLLSLASPAPMWIWGLAVFFVLLLVYIRWRSSHLLLMLACLLGINYGWWRGELTMRHVWQVEPARVHQAVFTVISPPQILPQRVRFTAEVRLPESGREYRLQLSDYHLREWQVGEHWQSSLRIRPLLGEVNGVGWNREAWALSHGLDGSAAIGRNRQSIDGYAAFSLSGLWQKPREALRKQWQGLAETYPLGAGLMQALSVGDQSGLPETAWQTFRPLGLNHLVSISGLHIGMVALLAGWLLSKILRVVPIAVRKPRLWVLLGGAGAAFAYAALSGFAVPTQRALLMLAFAAWAWWRHWSYGAWTAWWLAMAAVLLISPFAALSAGFWLSFLLVAMLLWAGNGVRQSAWRTLVRAQAVVLAAGLLLTAYFFGTVPLLSPLVNMAAIPWFSWVLVPFALLALLLPFSWFSQFAAATAEYTMRVLLRLAEYAPEYAVAHAPLPVYLAAIIGVLLLWTPRGLGLKPLALLLFLLPFCYQPPKPKAGEAWLTFLDVGQGLSVLLQTHRHNLLFDTGTHYAAQMQVLPELRAQGVRRLDALTLSHNDIDHDGGAALLQVAMKPNQIYGGQPNAYPFATQYCAGGMYWQWDGVWLEWLTPPPLSHYQDNDLSCVLRVVAADQAVLITGDLGKGGEAVLLEKYGDDLYSQVLVLGHHGSRTSNSAAFVNAVSPQWTVASAGWDNRYKHPHKEIQAILSARHIELLRTDTMGGLRLKLDKNGAEWQSSIAHQPYWQRKPLVHFQTQKTAHKITAD
ncbi:DNA internalization-related competence protein ComEC/Rec2 [Stenoxybacter acetivorans]|uniref:DNA internalization-related competence protein ComEC/Rec2 n=1 Tax=Stenoxybacter acetivorans TaxID=422441 RepID=UPI00068978A5|nr:DNA internalization-related competence protein ComEC/Rec2 [Stenoxybacter acetivorans]